MGGVLIILLIAGLLGGIGLLIGGPTPTLDNVRAHYHGRAYDELKGREGFEYDQAMELVLYARIILENQPDLTYEQWQALVLAQVANMDLRVAIQIQLETLRRKIQKAARVEGKNASDPDFRNPFIFAALKGLDTGIEQAEQYHGKPTPGMERAR